MGLRALPGLPGSPHQVKPMRDLESAGARPALPFCRPTPDKLLKKNDASPGLHPHPTRGIDPAALTGTPSRGRFRPETTMERLATGRNQLTYWRGSSVVEQGNHNPLVGGSNPSPATILSFSSLRANARAPPPRR